MEYKLGKLPAIQDPWKRTIKFSSIIRKELLPPLPDSYNVDESLGGVDDNHMFANDEYGDCVKAARAHQTLRFEKFEQGTQIEITDDEVVYEYLVETGGPDSGLYLLTSLKDWRTDGWLIGDKHYTIYAFTQLGWVDHTEVKYCTYLLGGVNFGAMIFQSDYDNFKASKPWTAQGFPGALLGGHGIYSYQFDSEGGTCMTWGKRQRFTWGWWDARVDEAYGIVDNKNQWMADTSPVDVEKLDGYLKEITSVTPSDCLVAKVWAGIFNGAAWLGHRKTRQMPYIPRNRR